jgi:hypothetical protein
VNSPARITSRWKAATIHLLLSAAVLAAVWIFVLVTWYPPGLLRMARADDLLLLLTVVGVVIGPLLTLIVYNVAKKSLRFDLAVIVLLQVAALLYGLNVLWQSRPVFIVGVFDRYELVFAHEIEDEDLARGSVEEFRTRPKWGPKLVGAMLPSTSMDRLQATLRGFAGKDIQLMPENYVSYRSIAPELLSGSLRLDALAETHPQTAEALLSAARGIPGAPDSVRYVPIVSSRGRATMLIDSGTGMPLRPVAVDPWPGTAERPRRPLFGW